MFCALRRNSRYGIHICLSGGGKPVQFLAFGQEKHCETTASRKVTIKPVRYIPLQEQVDNISLINIFASKASEIGTCMVEVCSQSELNTLPTELSGLCYKGDNTCNSGYLSLIVGKKSKYIVHSLDSG